MIIITTNQPDTELNLTLTLVLLLNSKQYSNKFIRDNVVAPFIVLSVVIVVLPVEGGQKKTSLSWIIDKSLSSYSLICYDNRVHGKRLVAFE